MQNSGVFVDLIWHGWMTPLNEFSSSATDDTHMGKVPLIDEISHWWHQCYTWWYLPSHCLVSEIFIYYLNLILLPKYQPKRGGDLGWGKLFFFYLNAELKTIFN